MKTKIFAIIATAVAALGCSVFILSAQAYPVSGTVLDENGDPILGATVKCKTCAKDNGTVTDFDGKFTLPFDVKNHKGHTIVFTFIGYEELEVVYNGQDPFIINMKPQDCSLEDL